MRVLHVDILDAPSAFQALHQRRCQIQRTKGDGACAIHSVFGVLRRGVLEKVGARHFLRDKFGEDVATFSARVDDVAIVGQLEDCLWKELVQPCAAKEAGLEDNRLIRAHNDRTTRECICASNNCLTTFLIPLADLRNTTSPPDKTKVCIMPSSA